MRRILAFIVALILFVVGVVLYGVLRNKDFGPDGTDRAGSFCSEYGIPADDPRTNPKPLNEDVASAQEAQFHQRLEVDGINSRYHVFTRDVDFSKPVGIVVRLHGDDAFEYRHTEGLVTCMAAVAASYNMILVVPHTPDRSTRTWWKDINTNQKWLSELVPQLERDYSNLDTEKTWWMGYSGGAEIISYSILPKKPDAITAGAIMVGGGGAPTDISDPDTPNPDLPLYWFVGSKDTGEDPAATFNAVAAAQEGSKWYSDHGYNNVEEKTMDGDDHFTIPQAGILDEVLRKHHAS